MRQPVGKMPPAFGKVPVRLTVERGGVVEGVACFAGPYASRRVRGTLGAVAGGNGGGDVHGPAFDAGAVFGGRVVALVLGQVARPKALTSHQTAPPAAHRAGGCR